MGGRVGHLMTIIAEGEVNDIETLNRIRGWIEDEARGKYGNFEKTTLTTDYDVTRNVYQFKLHI